MKVVCATNRMLFEDFCSHFHNLVICRVVNTHIFSTSRAWHESLFHSEWTEPDLCGGCLKNKDTFWCNPQVCVITINNSNLNGSLRLHLAEKANWALVSVTCGNSLFSTCITTTKLSHLSCKSTNMAPWSKNCPLVSP